MAQIDASIYNNLQQPKINTPFENAAMAQNLQQGQNQNRLAQMQFQEAERATGERNALSEIAKQYGNTPDHANQLMKAGYVEQSQKQSQYQATQAKTEREAEKANIEGHLQKFEMVARVMSGVRDQASYDAARQELTAILGPEVAAKIPPVYDPAAIAQSEAKSIPMKEQLANRWKALDYELSTKKFDYQQGNDAANRGVTMRGQDIGAANAAAGRAVTMRGQNMTDNRAANPVAKPIKAMPTSALKMQQEELDAISTASSINADLGAIEKQIGSGALKLGPVDNLVAKGRNMAGLSNESSRNLATFDATLERLRNDSLRLNKGVQTDGDSQRAWNELLKNVNDPKLVKQRLGEIKKINERAANIRKMNVDQIRANFGHDPMDTSKYEAQPAALGGSKLPGGWSVKER